MFLGPRGCLHLGMWYSAGWSTTGRTRLGRSIGPSSIGMTWEMVGVGMRSTSWMRPGSQGKLLGTCLLGGVFLVVFVRHLFLGDLSCFSFFPLIVLSCVGLSCEFSFGSLFFLLLLNLLCDHCGLSWVFGFW